MHTLYWILISASTFFSLIASGFKWSVISFIMPPMLEAVPNLHWHGLARFWIVLYENITQYPILLFILPAAIFCCGIFFNKKLYNIKVAISLIILSIVVLSSAVVLGVIGTYDMQEQMVTGMGLGN